MVTTRRHFMRAVGIGALVSTRSFAQGQSKVWRIGFLTGRHLEYVDSDFNYGPFTQGLRELGYNIGKNLTIEWRPAEGDIDRLPLLAAELVRLKVDVIVTAGTVAALAAQKATSEIPTVMVSVADPVGVGLVKSLARPGGNKTGFSNLAAELGPKLLEVLRSVVPQLSHVAVLVHPSDAGTLMGLKNIREAAPRFNLSVAPFEASSPQDISAAIPAMIKQKFDALIVLRNTIFQQQRKQIADLAIKHHLPSIGSYDEFAEAGGLISYGQNLRENYWRAAGYVDKILKGAKPGDLPVEQPTKFDFVINVKSAKALGIKVPQAALLRADRLIEQ